MSPGQTGHITGQMGRVPGTDGTHTRGCPAKILYVYWFFLSPLKVFLVISASVVFAVYESAKLPTSCLPTRGGSGSSSGKIFRLRPENNYLGYSAGADCAITAALLYSCC